MEKPIRTKDDLHMMQQLPLDIKVRMSKSRIADAVYKFGSDGLYISFSGGKDSTVLLDIVREDWPDIPAVFSNTGLEYPEIQKFVRTKENVTIVTPKMQFPEVISTYGYPMISKEVAEAIYYARRIKTTGEKNRVRRALNGELNLHEGLKTQESKRREMLAEHMENNGEKSRYNKEKWKPAAQELPFMISHYCCNVMKKSPMGLYKRQTHRIPFIGTLAEESRLREQAWLRHGCNSFEGAKQSSQPLSFWTEQDILQYIAKNNLPISSVYGDIVPSDSKGLEYSTGLGTCESRLKCTGCERTGCVYCGFGFHLEKGETRFQKLAKTHPKQYEYCLSGGQWVDNPAYDATASKYDGDWKNWNPKKIWVPSKQGLGMKFVFDEFNQLYGKNMMRYE